ncbi:hypothetical protein DSO57_1028460 [Entomophthora muscae]|uniref:Uncharacterized protein n=1 Tax=Entomophthora muscae TaxID=34485 RepID=A0ACC2U034_9FUNG|nr:hypothetical protein DSO57_1028460 [Entomophthora muscae]
MPVNLGAVPPTVKAKTLVLSQCPEFYSEETLILLQAIYLGLFWLGLIILLNPSNSFRNFTNVGDSPPHGYSFLLSCYFCHTGTLQAASLQAQPPAFFGLKSERNLTLKKFPRLASMSPSTSNPCLQKDPVSPANENAEPNNDHKIIGATTNEGLKNFPKNAGRQRMTNPAAQRGNFSLPAPVQPMRNHPCRTPSRVSKPW